LNVGVEGVVLLVVVVLLVLVEGTVVGVVALPGVPELANPLIKFETNPPS